MANSMIPMDNLESMTDIPTTVSPPSLIISPSSYPIHISSAPIPSPPLPVTATATKSSAKARPLKRFVRPRATTEDEKQRRLQERKVANRTAAKHSRERQKIAMEGALQENERLKQENAELLARLARLEQRMQAIESSHIEQQQQQRQLEAREVKSTHLPARSMSKEQQCPIPLASSSTPSATPASRQCSRTSRLTLAQTRLVVYALQILMHSFALSVMFRIPLTRFPTTSSFSQPHHSAILLHKRLQHSSHQWMPAHLGSATPNLHDLRGAIRSAFTLKGRVKSMVNPTRTRAGKEWLRMVRRQQGKGEYIRLIVKKKRMDK